MTDQYACYPVCVAVRDRIESLNMIVPIALYEAVSGAKQRRLVSGALKQLQHDHPVRWTDPIMTNSLLKRIRGMETVLYETLKQENRMLLYKIQHGDTHPIYFKDKRTAKDHQFDLIEAGAKSVVIMRGPDHWKGESFNKTTNTPSTQKNRRG